MLVGVPTPASVSAAGRHLVWGSALDEVPRLSDHGAGESDDTRFVREEADGIEVAFNPFADPLRQVRRPRPEIVRPSEGGEVEHAAPGSVHRGGDPRALAPWDSP